MQGLRLLWLIALILWTIALLRPVPPRAVAGVGGAEAAFWISKVAHISVYALLAGWGRICFPNPRSRIWLLLSLLAHGAATEFLQGFVGRGASMRDVGLDATGVGLGWGLMQGVQRRRRLLPEQRTKPSQ